MDGTEETHESFGMIGFSRVQGSPGPLFGSSLRHHNFMRLRIHRAVKHRDLHRNWYYSNGQLIEIDLSPVQFAELLTSMNVGDGVPCTIRAVGKEEMADCPAVDERQVYEDEFKSDVQKASENAAKLAADADAILSKATISAADRKALKSTLAMLMQDIRSNMPFVQTQFNEAMDKTVAEAKGEVEAFVQHKVASLGIEALREQVEGGKVELFGATQSPKSLASESTK